MNMMSRLRFISEFEFVLFGLAFSSLLHLLARIPQKSHLGILTNLLRVIWDDLWYLIGIYLVLVISFALMGWLIFGRYMDDFKYFSSSFGAVFQMSYGEGHSIQDLVDAYTNQRMAGKNDNLWETLLVLVYFLSLQVVPYSNT